MGNHTSQPSKREVTEHLKANLLESAKTLLKTDFNQEVDPNHPGLEDTVKALAKAQFAKSFGYDWNETSVSPRDMDPVNPQFQLASDYCIISADEDRTQAIANYVEHDLNIPNLVGWMKDTAKADLASIVGKYLAHPVDTMWHYGPATTQYDAKETEADSYKLDISLVYTNAKGSESAVEVSLHIFYFVAVYYAVKSPKNVTYAKLCKNAHDAAAALLKAPQAIESDTHLNTVLNQWATAQGGPFHNDFQRLWDDKPEDFATDETSPIAVKNTQLAYFNTKKPEKDFLKKYIGANILKGFNLPVVAMEDWLLTFLVENYQTILSQTNTSGWNAIKVDQTYGLTEASIRPIRFNGEIICWASEATIENGPTQVTVVVHYVYFLGFIYELMPDPIYKDLRRKLVQNVPGTDQNTLPPNISPDDLRNRVEAFNTSRFFEAYKNKFPEDMSAKDKNKKYWKGFFEFAHKNPSKDNVKIQVAEKLFQRDNTADPVIGHDLQPAVYDWLVNLLTSLSSETYLKNPNEWYNFSRANNFGYIGKKDNKPWILTVNTTWAYSNGTITENARGGKTLDNFYLSVLILAVVAPGEERDDDV